MIICFSGTGNSRLVAHELQRHIGGEIVELSGELLLKPGSRVFSVAPGEDVLWVFPIYSWGLPPVLSAFIIRSKFLGAEHARHFMVCTCGDDVGRADDQWRTLVGKRGWSPCTAFSVQMPNTYVCMKGFDVDSPEVERDKLERMPEVVAAIAERIRNGGRRIESHVVRGSWAWAKTAIVYPLFKRFCMSPGPFRATEACTGCGMCSRKCPMENISMSEGRPVWGGNCAMCLRCYHQCPANAVQYGKETTEKGQYHAPSVE